MVVEKEKNLPEGFSWKELTLIKAKIPMPNGWFYHETIVPGTKAFAVSREPVGWTGQEGFFKTGVSLNVILNMAKRTQERPESIAKDFFNRVPIVIPTSEIVVLREKPFVTYRRHHRSEPGSIRKTQKESIIFYHEVTANNKTGTVYFMYFETPESKWTEDAKTAKTMIENRVFDSSI